MTKNLKLSVKMKTPGYIFDFLLERVNSARASNLSNSYPQVAIFSHDHIGLSINQYGLYEKDLLDLVMNILNANGIGTRDICIDIGANIGNHSLFFSQYFSSVWAFEANPRTYKLLKFNADNVGNCKTYCYAISNVSDLNVSIKQDNCNIGGSRVIPLDLNQNGNNEIITKRLDDLVSADEHVSLIKLDVEGFELKCLQGALDIIRTNKPLVLLEQSSADIREGSSSSLDLLKSEGYQFFVPNRSLNLGYTRFARFTSMCLRSILPYSMSLKPTVIFAQRHYHMILGIHGDNL